LSKDEQAEHDATVPQVCERRAKLLAKYLDVYVADTGVVAARQQASMAPETARLWDEYLRTMVLRRDTGILNMHDKAIFVDEQ